MSVIELDHYQFVRVSGADTLQFLQGQLSCNLDNLSEELSLRGAICNLKGRVVADFRVVLDAEDCLLQTADGSAQAIVATLAKYAMFSKVELSIETNHLPPWGLLGEDAGKLLLAAFDACPAADDQVIDTGGIKIIRVAGVQARYELWFIGKASTAEGVTGADTREREHPAAATSLLESDSKASSGNWARQDILAGIVHVAPAQSESYTPQLLNYDTSGVIDFNKGCYTGQEVVARMYYRGKAKKRLYLLSSDTEIQAGDSVTQTYIGRETQADIVTFSNGSTAAADSNLLLAVLTAENVANGGKFSLAANPQVALQVLELPDSSPDDT